jgi:hypothetical protein
MFSNKRKDRIDKSEILKDYYFNKRQMKPTLYDW